jgi:uncharacterized protein
MFIFGLSLLPALPIGILGTAVGWAILSLSALLIPMSGLARFIVSNPALVDFVGSLAMGLFSSLLMLTLLRGLLLACNRNTFACRYDSNNGDLSGGSGHR